MEKTTIELTDKELVLLYQYMWCNPCNSCCVCDLLNKDERISHKYKTSRNCGLNCDLVKLREKIMRIIEGE